MALLRDGTSCLALYKPMNSKLADTPLPRLAARRTRAFSLVEVTLAMGIMSFALVGLMGLLPIGVSTFHNATDSSTGTQIAQRLLNEAQQTDFDQLIAAAPTPLTFRYFDDQGNEVTPANKTQAVYYTNLVVVSGTTLPGGTSNQNLATVSLQIANNPGGKSMPAAGNTLWTAAPGVTISTYATNVARSK